MNKHEFRNEYMRLANGFGKGAIVTDERLGAMFEVLGGYDLREMAAACDKCLRDLSMPSFDRLHSAMDWARDEFAKRDRGISAEFASRVMDGFLPNEQAFRHSISTDELAGCRAMKLAYKRSWDSNISPVDTIPLIEELAKTWPWLADEITYLREMGATWRNEWGQPSDSDLGAQAHAAVHREATEREKRVVGKIRMRVPNEDDFRKWAGQP